jgi:GDP-L-fucose synthase
MKVLVAGASGLAGSAISRAFRARGDEVIPLNRSVVDLMDLKDTRDFLKFTKPNLVVNAAAKVGGIGINNLKPVDFLHDNLGMQNNLFQSALETKVESFVFLGSSCIYPRDCPQPIREEYLMTGPLEESNSAYAIAKIAGIEMVKSVRKQYGLNWISLMPTNLYGAGDNFNLSDSHVLPAMIRKIVEAKRSGISSVTFWGTGSPLREFLHADDLASAVVLSSEKYDSSSHLNVGTGQDLSILKLASLISEIEEYGGEILWDSTKPDGTMRKVLDISRISALGWEPTISLTEGIRATINWFKTAVQNGEARL